MSVESTWFVAEAIFEATVHTEAGPVTPVAETLLFLVEARDHSTAVTKAESIARAKEHSYDNEKGERVSWNFIRLVDLSEMVDQDFRDGAELKSTMTEAPAESRLAGQPASNTSGPRRTLSKRKP
jgi:hypothetical protein